MFDGLEIGSIAAAVAVAAALAAFGTFVLFALRSRRASSGPDGAESDRPRGELDWSHLAAAAQRAAARGQEDQLPDLYLRMAHHRTQSGHPDAAGDLLLKCVHIATKLGHKEALARARLELGDVACVRGDLTTACEHWQMARGLFLDLGRQREHAAVETRMRRNGCPTDWVLNEF